MHKGKHGELVLMNGEHGLDAAEKTVLAEALREADAARDVMEAALVGFGRWILINVFHDDATAALEGKRENRVWQSLRARAGGPSLRVSEKLLYVAVDIAAHDKRINDETWRLLEPGRKELLLPLGDERQMRQAAKQVVAMKMSQSATKAYVTEMRAATGKKATSRATGPVLHRRMTRVRSVLDAADLLRNVRRVAPTLAAAERAALRGEVEAIRDRAKEILEVLRAK
jgi:hypothetical protein